VKALTEVVYMYRNMCELNLELDLGGLDTVKFTAKIYVQIHFV